MEFLYLVLGIGLSILTYFAYKFTVFRKKQIICERMLEEKSMQEIENIRREYSEARIRELRSVREHQKKTNIFRKMAIEEIAKQKLVYDEKTGRYIRRRQIN